MYKCDNTCRYVIALNWGRKLQNDAFVKFPTFQFLENGSVDFLSFNVKFILLAG